MKFDNKCLFFVSNNIGGLASLLPIIKYYEIKKYNCILLYNRKNEEFLKNFKSIKLPINKKINFSDIKNLLLKFNPDIVITSTTFPKDLILGDVENKFIYQSNLVNIKSITILDHWCGYKERFYTKINGIKKYTIPNHICVMDTKAKKEILNNIKIPKKKIKVTGNPAWDKIKNIKPKINKVLLSNNNFNKRKKSILFISEVIIEEKKRIKYKFDEIEILRNLISIYEKDYNILIKQHPRESNDKYLNLLKNYKSKNIIILDKKVNPYNLCYISDVIIGMTSIMLVELSLFGLNVISLQPSKQNKPVIDFGYNVKKIYSYKDLRNFKFRLNKKRNINKKYHFDALAKVKEIVNLNI